MNLFVNSIVFGMLLYFVFSFTEYGVHKYLMHSSKNEYNMFSIHHWNHHEHTLEDMNLHKSESYNSSKNKYLGLYFTWFYTFLVFIVGLTEAFLLSYLLNSIKIKVDSLSIIIWVLMFSIYQSSFWNTIHPDIHHIEENITWYEGIPGWKQGFSYLFSGLIVEKDKTLYEWFQKNHRLHHLRKGNSKGNYNVTLPGADWMMGTMYDCP